MKDKIKVVLFTAGYDTGGQGYRIKRAFDRFYPDEFVVRSVHSSPNYFAYPFDVLYEPRKVMPLFEEADVLHMRNGLEGLKRLRPDAADGGVGLVCHWHGTRFRQEHKELYPEVSKAGAFQIVSTIDLAILEPGLTWLPSPVNMEAMDLIRKAAPLREADAPIRLAHAPTNRKVKSTEAIMQAVQLVHRKSLPIVLDLIERKPWAVVLERKALADIYVDQLLLGYGNNALEAWAMGLPVIAGVEEPLTRYAMLETFGNLPFFEADLVTLAARIEELATDRNLRAQWGALGYDHVRRFHDEKVVADQLAGIYRMAYERKVANADR